MYVWRVGARGKLRIRIQNIFRACENVANVTVAAQNKSEIGAVLSELEGFAVALINRNRSFDFSPELLVSSLNLATPSGLSQPPRYGDPLCSTLAGRSVGRGR